MANLQIFAFEGTNEIRTLLINDEPYFVGKDVAEVLGYSNASKAVMNHVDLEDKKFEMIAHSQNGNVSETKTAVINESGLYSLILKSKLPSAKKFKRWVTSEVLPTIRKHGMYATEELLNNPDLLIQVATELKKEREQRLLAEQRIKELQPKANYYDLILNNPSLMPISVIAKNYGMSGRKMNELLHELKIQYKQCKTWLLYAKYQEEGYTHTEMLPVKGTDKLQPSTKWTQKGHLFLYEKLKQHNVYPAIEVLFAKEG